MGDDKGFIAVFRKIEDNPIWQDSQLFQLFIFLLIHANIEDKSFWFNGEEVTVKRGQLITGEYKIAAGIPSISRGSIWYLLTKLEKLGIIRRFPSNKNSLITIVKYDDYNPTQEKLRSKVRNRLGTTEEQIRTTKQYNNITINNNSSLVPEAPNQPTEDQGDFFNNPDKQEKIVEWLMGKGVEEGFARRELASFVNYWTERNAKGKMRWQEQRFFEVRKRLATWFKKAVAQYSQSRPQQGGRTRRIIK